MVKINTEIELYNILIDVIGKVNICIRGRKIKYILQQVLNQYKRTK